MFHLVVTYTTPCGEFAINGALDAALEVAAGEHHGGGAGSGFGERDCDWHYADGHAAEQARAVMHTVLATYKRCNEITGYTAVIHVEDDEPEVATSPFVFVTADGYRLVARTGATGLVEWGNGDMTFASDVHGWPCEDPAVGGARLEGSMITGTEDIFEG